jgi:hypothetical protein
MILDNNYMAEQDPDILKKIIFALNQEILALEKQNIQLKERIVVLNFQIAKNVNPEFFSPMTESSSTNEETTSKE